MRRLVLSFGFIIGLMMFMVSCNTTSANTTAEEKAPQIEEEVVTEVAVEEPKKEKEQMVKLTTEYGDIIIKLYNETPLHRDNFIKLAKEGFYDGTLFHRVIKGFMIQGGDPQSKAAVAGAQYGNGGPGYTIPAEFNNNLIHKKGALSAARLGDGQNPQRASSGSQFYIVQGKSYTNMQLNQMEQQAMKRYTPEQKEAYMTLGGTPFLDRQYTVFGEVVMGLAIIDQIAAVKTVRERPVKDIKMTIEVIEE